MVLGDDVIRLGGDDVIRLGRRGGFASVGEQLRKRKDLPLPIRFISSPFLTGGLIGGLGLILGGGILPAIGLAGGIPTIAGAVKGSPKLEGLIKEKILRPEKFGERLGGFVEDPFSPFKKAGQKIRDVITSPDIPVIPIVTAGVVGGLALEGVRRFRDRETPTEIERQLQVPTLTPDLPLEPTPIGAVQVPVVEKKEQQPINIDINVEPEININNLSRPKNEIFINNIIQNI